MKKILSYPILSIFLLLIWLSIQRSVSLANIIVGIVLAIVIPLFCKPFLPQIRSINLIKACRLFLIVLYDIVVSCIKVSKTILLRSKQVNSQFVEVPLDTSHAYVNTLLTLIITTTPGTISVEHLTEKNCLLVHCLDTEDPQGEIDGMKTRYEAALIEIFSAQIITPAKEDNTCSS